MSLEKIEKIHRYWFRDLKADELPSQELSQLWFKKSEQTDADIRKQFLADLEAAKAGAYDDWENTPQGALALIVLLDQFSRNLFRGTADAFAQDPKALAITKRLIESGRDSEFTPIKRVFLYLPLEHSEDIEAQELSLKKYQQLLDNVPSHMHETFANYYDYAKRHYDIIARFGRYPHRNDFLGRESTAEELAFLKQPGSSF